MVRPYLSDIPEMRRIRTIHFVGIGGAGMRHCRGAPQSGYLLRDLT